MTPEQILSYRLFLEGEIKEMMVEIRDLQEMCEHENAEHINKASTGNYDPYNDEYWTEHHCFTCDKRWNSPQR